MTDSQNDIGAPRQVQGEFVPFEPLQTKFQGNTREDVFNEVIYGLDVLHRSAAAGDYPGARGILFALDYVKAMLEVEA